MNITTVVDLEIKGFSGGSITRKEAGITNGMVDISQTEPVVTQRPSIDIFEDPDDEPVTDNRGRAVYYWDATDSLYFVNNNKVYKGTYGTVVGTISTGTHKCKILEGYSTSTSLRVLIILDSENDEAWTLTTADVFAQITDTDFPMENTGLTASQRDLVHGGAILNGHLYILNLAGDIFNSDLDNPSSWTATNNINAEREEDNGVYLGKHHNELVAFSTRTIEFFFDNANSVASPLNRREDISYNTGCADGHSVWEDGDRIFFIGAVPSGNLGVYSLINYRIKKVSKSGFDSLLTQALTKDGYSSNGSGFTAFGHTFYVLSLYTAPSDISVEKTYIYDMTSGLWHEWETSINSQAEFPLMDWSIRTGGSARYGEGVMQNGDLFTIQDDLTPQDSKGARTYVATDYVVAGYISDSNSTGTPMTLKIRMGQFDGKTNKNKFAYHVRPKMDATTSSQTMTIRWADNNEDTFTTGLDIDVSDQYASIIKAGKFRRRNHELEYSGTEQIWIESLEADIREGTV